MDIYQNNCVNYDKDDKIDSTYVLQVDSNYQSGIVC
jgi:hypothetical protein